MNNRPIGIFDSGLGGLTVVKEIIKVLPHEDLVYLGDTARVPYGTRSGDVVRKFSFQDAKFLLGKKVKCIVIACNTSSAYASEDLKKRLKVPVFEVITPASKKAVYVSKNKKLGVIGTRGTISSGAYQKAIKKINPKAKVFAVPCPLYVPFIEEGEFGRALDTVIEGYISSFKNTKIDTLILGCTHYPIIEEKLRNYLGANVKFVNPGREVAEELKNYLEKKHLTSKNTDANRQYYVTDLTERFIKVAEMFLGGSLSGKIRKVDIDR